MRALARLVASYLGGMIAAVGLVLAYVFLLGAPDLPRLPVIGVPHTYVAVALLVVWAFIQLYVSILGLIADGILAWTGWRERPGFLMALGHGLLASAALLVYAYWYRPDAFTLRTTLLVPLAVHGVIRLLFGRVPTPPARAA